MLTEWQNEIMSFLKEWLEDSFGEVLLLERDDITFLRFVPALFEDGSAEVMVEVCLYDYGEEMTIAQIYSTMLIDVAESAETLCAHIPEWNFYSLAGAYGIYEKLGHLYHKHSIALVSRASAADQAEMVFASICLAMDEMARRINEAAAICGGE